MDRISKAIELASQKKKFLSNKQEVSAQLDGREYQFSGGAVVTEVPDEVLRANKVVIGVEDEKLLDAYKLLRTRISQRMRQNGWTTLGLTSTSPRDGKTLTAINLGLALAMDSNVSVVLVDTDLRSPSVHQFFGLMPERGLAEYLEEGGDLSDYLINPGVERFSFLPCLDRIEGSSEVLSSSKMRALIELLKTEDQSRIVLFDLPPVFVGDDVTAFSQRLDTMLMVAEDRKTRADEINKAQELLEGIDVIGCVLNKSDERLYSESYGGYY